jgi:hypothetical protein
LEDFDSRVERLRADDVGVVVRRVRVAADCLSTYAGATAQRTFVASNGLDSNPCTIPAPCRSFTTALTQTTTGGEIIVKDSAGYGPVVITKPISIVVPPGIYAAITVSARTGIVVDPGTGDVTLRGLTLAALGGDTGIDFKTGDVLRIEDVSITGFTGYGVSVRRTSGATVIMRNVTSRKNLMGIGIGTTTGVITATVDHSQFDGNTNTGAYFYDNVLAFVRDSTMTGNVYGLTNQPTIVTASRVTCTNCTMSANSGAGVLSGGLACLGSLARTTVINSVVSGNQVGIWARYCVLVYAANNTINENAIGLQSEGFGGDVHSYQDNRLFNNATAGTFGFLLGGQ